MKRILSFGGGLQTTALAILVKQGKVQVDEAVFADTGAEKPETYWYIENYIKPLFANIALPFSIIQKEKTPIYPLTLYEYLWQRRDVPSITQRRCTDHYKIRPIQRKVGTEGILLIGFSTDEAHRAQRKKPKKYPREYPLLEIGISADDCRLIIGDYGWPIPLKSSCFFCPFQHPVEWNRLKSDHPDLFQQALKLEENYHNRRPDMKNYYGLLRGTPLWKMKDGLQPEMFADIGYSCWSGYCSH
jgi:hypothetical protein